MGKPRIYGMNRLAVPNKHADQRRGGKAALRQKAWTKSKKKK